MGRCVGGPTVLRSRPIGYETDGLAQGHTAELAYFPNLACKPGHTEASARTTRT